MTVENILATYDRADLATLKLGRSWYRDGGRIATTVGHGDRHLGAGIISALSPRKVWSTNVAQALAVSRGEHVGGFQSGLDKVARLRAGENPADVMRAAKHNQGRKTEAFFWNLAGNLAWVTVDIWALRIALDDFSLSDGDYQRVLGRKGGYDLVSEAYLAAAAERNVRPAVMQATTWIVGRGSHE